MKMFQKHDGFTLVELMVVVAIIGILSAVAIPNFNKYQARAKTSEAKLQLASVYSTEITTYSDYDHYGSCLSDMGYEATSRGYYIIGFSAAATTANSKIASAGGGTCSSSHAVAPTNHVEVGGSKAATTDITDSNFGGSGTAPAVASNGSSFKAGAIAILSTSTTTKDAWTIDQAKALKHSKTGY